MLEELKYKFDVTLGSSGEYNWGWHQFDAIGICCGNLHRGFREDGICDYSDDCIGDMGACGICNQCNGIPVVTRQ